MADCARVLPHAGYHCSPMLVWTAAEAETGGGGGGKQSVQHAAALRTHSISGNSVARWLTLRGTTL